LILDLSLLESPFIQNRNHLFHTPQAKYPPNNNHLPRHRQKAAPHAMTPYQNTRSGLRSNQQVQDEQPTQNTVNTRSDSSSSSQVKDEQPTHTTRSSLRSNLRFKSSPQVEGKQPYQSTSTPPVRDEQPCFLLDMHPEIRNE
jgi:hypothetical protein